LKETSKYEIQFSGLSNGKHEIDWKLESDFFEGLADNEILESALSCKVVMDKNERMLQLEFQIFGEMKTLCDHCGVEVWLGINAKDELIARFAEETDLTGDEVIFLGNSEYKLDIRQFFMEFALLALPSKRVHAKGDCNPEVEKYFVSTDLKSDIDIERDPRWKALDNLN
jgi:uncharacterized protein